MICFGLGPRAELAGAGRRRWPPGSASGSPSTRLVAAAGAVLLCGAATAVAGPIAFVGLVVPAPVPAAGRRRPPLAAAVLRVDRRGLLIAADVVGRVVARPEEIDVGIITALVGAPVFIYIVRRQKVREL